MVSRLVKAWLGPVIAAASGCSLLYDVDDLPRPADYGDPIKFTDGAHVMHDPTLVGDGSFVYFTNDENSGGGTENILRRDRVNDSWSEERPVVPLSTESEDDLMPRLDAAGALLYFVRPGEDGLQAFVSTRAEGPHAWNPPVPVPQIDGPGDERAVAPCEGALFVIRADLEGNSTLDEVRSTTKLAVAVPGLADVRSVWASLDCLRLLVSARSDQPDLDIFLLRRSSVAGPWGAPERLDALTTDRDETSPTSTTDGEMIVFERDDTIWEAHRAR